MARIYRRRKYVRKAAAARRVYRRRSVVRRSRRSYVRRAPARRRVYRRRAPVRRRAVAKRYPARTPRSGNSSPLFTRAAMEQMMMAPRSKLDWAHDVLASAGIKRERGGESLAMALGDEA